ncbi:MAG: hypothetical protein IPG94_15785 [Kineosporiaceae bacterium]|nr:hypothetical protein [Kineosporiaceae bacterium]
MSTIDNPARRHLDDARAVASDRNVPEDQKAQVVAEAVPLCPRVRRATSALPAPARRMAGDRREVETEICAAGKTSRRLALVVTGYAAGSLEPWKKGGTYRVTALGVCSSAVHQGMRRDPHAGIGDVAQVVDELEQMRG